MSFAHSLTCHRTIPACMHLPFSDPAYSQPWHSGICPIISSPSPAYLLHPLSPTNPTYHEHNNVTSTCHFEHHTLPLGLVRHAVAFIMLLPWCNHTQHTLAAHGVIYLLPGDCGPWVGRAHEGRSRTRLHPPHCAGVCDPFHTCTAAYLLADDDVHCLTSCARSETHALGSVC